MWVVVIQHAQFGNVLAVRGPFQIQKTAQDWVSTVKMTNCVWTFHKVEPAKW